MSVPTVFTSTSAGSYERDTNGSTFLDAIPCVVPGRTHWLALPVSHWWNTVAERLGPRDLTRRLWHMTPGLLPCLFWVLPHADPLTPVWLFNIAMDGFILAFSCCYWSRTFSREGERNCLCASIGYSTLVVLAVFLFPGQIEIGMAVLAILAFGDGSATLGGLLLKGPTLPWNREKTWAGSTCFLLGGVPLATLYYWAEARPGVPWNVALLCAGTAAVMSAIAESVSSRINDNIRVGVTALLMMVNMNHYLLGWS